MPIKFDCPHCHKKLSVKEHLAGKRGACPNCKQMLTVPVLMPPAPAPDAPEPGPAPVAGPSPRSPANGEPQAAATLTNGPTQVPFDPEAEAASVFSDPPPAPPVAETSTTTIEFPCPYCDTPVKVGADLAGKNAPCPECRRIVKVPAPTPKTPAAGPSAPKVPSGARRAEEPAPEGVWSSTTSVARVSQEALVEADALPEKKEPVTVGQWVFRGTVLAVCAVASLLGVSWYRSGVAHSREEQTLQGVLDYVTNPEARKQAGPEALAELHLGLGSYYLRSREPDSATAARKQFEQAFSLLSVAPAAGERAAPAGSDRDLALADLALAQVELGGTKEESDDGLRLKWDDAHKALRASLGSIRPSAYRLEAFRQVSRRLIARGQPPERVQALAAQVFPAGTTPDALGDRWEATATAGLELLKAGQKEGAEKIATQVAQAYEAKSARPPLRPAAVALALALKRPPPLPGKAPFDEDMDLLGQVEGLARQEKWKESREFADAIRNPRLKLRALLALAGVAAESQTAAGPQAEAALLVLAKEIEGKKGLSWVLLRVVEVSAQAGVPEERVQVVLQDVEDPAVQGRARLVLLHQRLATLKQPADLSVLEKIEPRTLAYYQAREALTRHNAALESGWSRKVQEWDEPARAFGSLGVARSLQGD